MSKHDVSRRIQEFTVTVIDIKRSFLTATCSVVLALLLSSCKSSLERPRADVPASGAAPVVIKLIAFNDFHGNVNPPRSSTRLPDPASPDRMLDLPTGGVEYLSGLVGQLKAQNELNAVVAAGDLIGGSPLVASLFHHEPSIELLSELGLEFSSVGNHEFDAGRVELLRMQNGGCFPGGTTDTCRNGRFAGARFKYLAANVIDEQTGKSLFPPYAIKQFKTNGGQTIDVAFIGLVLKGTPLIVVPEGVRGLSFIDEATAANAQVAQLHAKGIESIVVLIHEGGLATSQAFDDTTCPGFSGAITSIVERFDPAIDVVVSGHTHRSYICRHNGRLLTSAGAEGRFVTDIDMTIDPRTKDVIAASARQLAAVNDTAPNPLSTRFASVPKDARLSPLVEFYNAEAAPLAQREVGRITHDIVRAPLPSGESALGNLIADAQLAATRMEGAQIAFMNRGGMRADLRSADGVIRYTDVFSVHPFGNGLVTMTLTGAAIETLLEEQWTAADTRLQVSAGFAYAWDPAAKPGQRIAPDSVRLNGTVIDPARSYRVTVNEFLAQGGDGFTVLSKGTERVRGVADVEALERYLATNSPISPPVLDRVGMIGEAPR